MSKTWCEFHRCYWWESCMFCDTETYLREQRERALRERQPQPEAKEQNDTSDA